MRCLTPSFAWLICSLHGKSSCIDTYLRGSGDNCKDPGSSKKIYNLVQKALLRYTLVHQNKLNTGKIE